MVEQIQGEVKVEIVQGSAEAMLGADGDAVAGYPAARPTSSRGPRHCCRPERRSRARLAKPGAASAGRGIGYGQRCGEGGEKRPGKIRATARCRGSTGSRFGARPFSSCAPPVSRSAAPIVPAIPFEGMDEAGQLGFAARQPGPADGRRHRRTRRRNAQHLR